MEPLPIDEHIPAIRETLRRDRAVVVVAPPGAGKTTRVPPALADAGPVIVLQPRRIAARSLARRIADERGWTLGQEVGWQVRFDRRYSAATRVLVVTEGILTARALSDPLLSAFRTIVIDEFHERSLHADLALALARQAGLARHDLDLVVMSATLDAEPVARFLGGAGVVRVTGRSYPIDVAYAPGVTAAEAIRAACSTAGGQVLVFLPGAPEIGRLARELSAERTPAGWTIVTLSGGSSADEQDAAISAAVERRVILATNVAETSLTIPGVTSVIDTGLHKVPRLDPALGFDRLVTERISRDAAEQRAGRAGRTRPGRAVRLWDPRDEMRAHREPEIARVDLSAPILDVLAWGGDPATFAWFEPPGAERLAESMRLLARLDAVAGARLTPIGALLQRLPVPPRLARVLVAAGGSDLAAAACAVLTERWRLPRPDVSGSSDVIALADRLAEAPEPLRRAAREIAAIARRVLEDPSCREAARQARLTGPDEETIARRALLSGFPDRLARRREPGSSRLVLASGHGATLDAASVVKEGELLLALDVEAGARGPGAAARVRIASRVEREWLPAPRSVVVHRLDERDGTVRAVDQTRLDDLVLDERPIPARTEDAWPLLVEAFVARGITTDQSALAARCRFAGVTIDLRAIAEAACAGTTVLPALDLARALGFDRIRALERVAPAQLALPSGRSVALDYREDGTVAASVKLQELFGLGDSPRIGGAPVLFLLLAPNGRPVQTTRDLRSFWERTYPEVRKELRARYPRHPWPEDPWTAVPTHRPKPRGA